MKQDMMGWQWHQLKLRSCKKIMFFLFFNKNMFFLFFNVFYLKTFL